jgi:hypothetical protein
MPVLRNGWHERFARERTLEVTQAKAWEIASGKRCRRYASSREPASCAGPDRGAPGRAPGLAQQESEGCCAAARRHRRHRHPLVLTESFGSFRRHAVGPRSHSHSFSVSISIAAI